jgi:hypothetical protein
MKSHITDRDEEWKAKIIDIYNNKITLQELGFSTINADN